MSTDRLLSWLLTYSVHSTLFLGLAWLVAGRLSRRAPAAAEVVWRFALVAGLATATLSSLSSWRPAGGAWSLAAFGPATAARESVRLGGTLQPSAFGPAPAPKINPSPHRESLSSETRLASPPLASSSLTIPRSIVARASWKGAALAAWFLGAALLTLGTLRAYSRLSARLRDRPRVVGGDLHTQLRQLAGDADVSGIRLTCTSRVPVPLALGWRRPEICVPPRALAALTVEQQEGMLAHELAHLVRRDPVWLVAIHLITCIAFFQPLNWIARRRLRELSELLADEWAVSRTGRPLSLAGCLAEVAGWAFGHRRLPVAAMADRPSNLARRITRLLDGEKGNGRVRRLTLASGLGLSLVLVLGAAPVVRSAESDEASEPQRRGSAASERRAREAAADAAERRAEIRESREADRDRRDAARDREDAARERAEAARERSEDADASDHEGHEDALEDGLDIDVDVDVDDSIDAAVEGAMAGAMAGLDDSLSSLDSLSVGLDIDLGDLDELASLDAEVSREMSHRAGDLDRLRSEGKLTAEEQRRLSREMAEKSRELVDRLQPRMKRLSEDIARQVEQSMAGNEEMRKLGRDMAKRAAELKSNPEATRDLEELSRQLSADGRISREDAKKLEAEARRLAERIKLSDPQLRELQEMARKQSETARKIVAEHRDEIEAARREMRQDIEREMEGMRQQLRQDRIEQRQRQRDEKREHRENSGR